MFAGKNKTEKKEAATDANIVPGSARKQQRYPTPVKKASVCADRNPAYQEQRLLPLRHYRGIVGWINGGRGREKGIISRVPGAYVCTNLLAIYRSVFPNRRERNIFIKHRRNYFIGTLITIARSSRVDRLCLEIHRDGASSNNVNKTLSRNISLE